VIVPGVIVVAVFRMHVGFVMRVVVLRVIVTGVVML
jgi:hypothetical protein